MPFNEDQLLPASEAAPVATQSVFSWWGLLGTLMVFLVILLVSLWILRRLNQANVRKLNAPWARLIDRQVLNGQQCLYLIELAGQLQILGGSEHYLVKIGEIHDPKVAADILEEIATRPGERTDGWTKCLQKLRVRTFLRQKNSFSAEFERLLEEVEKR